MAGREPSEQPRITGKTVRWKGLTLSSGPSRERDEAILVFPCLPLLTTCLDDTKPCMILKALDESYKNHIGFAIIRASGEEQ